MWFEIDELRDVSCPQHLLVKVGGTTSKPNPPVKPVMTCAQPRNGGGGEANNLLILYELGSSLDLLYALLGS
jgi:hypothetical protein